MNKGANLFKFSKEVLSYTKSLLVDNFSTSHHKLEALRVSGLAVQWLYLTGRIAAVTAFNKDMAGSASVDYLMYSGYVTMSFFWLRMMEIAAVKLAANPTGPDAEFYKSKIATGKFYFSRILPRTKSLAATMVRLPHSIMAMPEDQFSVGLH